MPPSPSGFNEPASPSRVLFVCGGILGSRAGSALALGARNNFRPVTSHPLLSRGAERISGSQSADENVNHFTPARRRARYGRAGDSKSNQKFPKREFFIFQAW